MNSETPGGELAPETSRRPENSHYCRSSGNSPAVSGGETEFLLMSSGVESSHTHIHKKIMEPQEKPKIKK